MLDRHSAGIINPKWLETPVVATVGSCKMSKLLSYRLKVFGRPIFLLVFLGADGLIADFSWVED